MIVAMFRNVYFEISKTFPQRLISGTYRVFFFGVTWSQLLKLPQARISATSCVDRELGGR